MKYLLIIGLSLFLFTGCVMTKMLIPDVETRMNQAELTHKSVVADKTQEQLSKIEIESDKGKLGIANLIYKTGKHADDITPSAAENMVQQYMRMQGQGVLDEQLNAGFEWTTRTISEIAGGATGTGGLMLLARSLLRKSKIVNVMNDTLPTENKRVVKEALSHTGLDRQIKV